MLFFITRWFCEMVTMTSISRLISFCTIMTEKVLWVIDSFNSLKKASNVPLNLNTTFKISYHLFLHLINYPRFLWEDFQNILSSFIRNFFGLFLLFLIFCVALPFFFSHHIFGHLFLVAKQFLIKFLPFSLVLSVQMSLVELEKSIFNDDWEHIFKIFPVLD